MKRPENATKGAKQALWLPLFQGWKTKHQAHQPLIGSQMTANVLAEVPFTELFFSESDPRGYKIFSFVARMLKDFYRHYYE